ncbi:MAG: hypothetical protein Q9169_000041 [Polycauliona sp. 2 TL-2023]
MSLPHIPVARPSYPLPFYSTTTTTLHTTTSATIGAILHLTIPTPLTPIPTSYTTPPIPDSPASKAYPYGLPILVLTELDAVVYDPSGRKVVSTVTTVQTAPGGGATEMADGKAYLKNAWGEWTPAERGGVVAGIVLVVVFMMGMGVWCCCRSGAWEKRGRKKGRRRSSLREGDRKRWRWDTKKKIGLPKDVEMESEVGGKDEAKRPEVRGAKRMEGLPKISITRQSPETPQEDLHGTRAVRGREPAGEPYQMSGALQVPRRPAATLLRSPVSAAHVGAEGRQATQFVGEADQRRTSAYRAMRAQERREERARAYVQESGHV